MGIRLKIKTAAALYTQAEANVLLQEIQRENPAIHEYILNAGLQNFFRSRTEHARFDIISNQAIESWNKITRPWRELPRLAYMLKVEAKVASIFSKRLQQINAAPQADIRNTALVPKVSEQITASMEESNHYEALQIQPNIFRVYVPGSSTSWEVNLSEKHGKCTCGRMWEKWITCVHAIVAIRRFRTHGITDFVHPSYFLSSWEQCYSIPLRAADTNNLEPTNCLPPLIKRVRGRPKGSRNKSQREVEDMLQRVRHCRNCGAPGHTAAQCGENAPARVIDAGGALVDPQTGFVHI